MTTFNKGPFHYSVTECSEIINAKSRHDAKQSFLDKNPSNQYRIITVLEVDEIS